MEFLYWIMAVLLLIGAGSAFYGCWQHERARHARHRAEGLASDNSVLTKARDNLALQNGQLIAGERKQTSRINSLKSQLETAESSADDLSRALQGAEGRIRKLTEEKEAEKRSHSTTKGQLTTLRGKYELLEARLGNPAPKQASKTTSKKAPAKRKRRNPAQGAAASQKG